MCVDKLHLYVIFIHYTNEAIDLAFLRMLMLSVANVTRSMTMMQRATCIAIFPRPLTLCLLRLIRSSSLEFTRSIEDLTRP